jgi:hypothetical protein
VSTRSKNERPSIESLVLERVTTDGVGFEPTVRYERTHAFQAWYEGKRIGQDVLISL